MRHYAPTNDPDTVKLAQKISSAHEHTSDLHHAREGSAIVRIRAIAVRRRRVRTVRASNRARCGVARHTVRKAVGREAWCQNMQNTLSKGKRKRMAVVILLVFTYPPYSRLLYHVRHTIVFSIYKHARGLVYNFCRRPTIHTALYYLFIDCRNL